jgi:hypothetical protein
LSLKKEALHSATSVDGNAITAMKRVHRGPLEVMRLEIIVLYIIAANDTFASENAPEKFILGKLMLEFHTFID